MADADPAARRRCPHWNEMDIFWAAKAGELDRVKTLVEAQPELVNERAFDATALFYACLCGHYAVAEYLLERGSSCAEDTFDGDRCLYGALTDEIRHLLKRYSQRRTFVLSQHVEEVYRMLNTQARADFELVAQGRTFRCHRVVLAARLPGFARRLRRGGAWFRRSKPVHVKAKPGAVMALLRYCYSDTLDCADTDADDLIALAKSVGLPGLARAVDVERMLVHVRTKPTAATARVNGDLVTSAGPKRVHRFVKLRPLGRDTFSRDFGRAFLLMGDIGDLDIVCGSRAIPVHLGLVCARCPYFAALFSDSNIEAFCEPAAVQAFPFRVVQACVLFLYTDGPGCEELLFAPNHGVASSADVEATALQDLIALFDMATQCILPRLCDFVVGCLERRGLIHEANVNEWLELAATYENQTLQRSCFAVAGKALMNQVVLGAAEFDVAAFRSFLDGCSDAALRDYFIAEVREAFVEAVPTEFGIAERDRFTDEFEALLGYVGPEEGAGASTRAPTPKPSPPPLEESGSRLAR